MRVNAHPGALTYLVAFLRSEKLPVPRQLERHARNATFAERAVDAVSPSLIIRALEECASLARRPDFSIAFAQWVNSRGFGPLSLLGEQCPTLAYALEARRRYMPIVNDAYAIRVRRFGEEAHIVHDVLSSFRPNAGQFLAGVMVFTVRLARRALMANWRPLRVEFGYARPPDVRIYERFFQCPMLFEAEHFTVICPTADLDRPLPGHDPEMLAFIESHLDALSVAWPSSLEAQVERLIATNLEAGFSTVANVAAILAMSPRTLQRRLTTAGTSFAQILDRVRREIVLTFFRETPRHAVIALAHQLGYSDASTASRFIAAHFRMDSRALRLAVRNGRNLASSIEES
jgi:AraC-like DNA-binding protein